MTFWLLCMQSTRSSRLTHLFSTSERKLYYFTLFIGENVVINYTSFVFSRSRSVIRNTGSRWTCCRSTGSTWRQIQLGKHLIEILEVQRSVSCENECPPEGTQQHAWLTMLQPVPILKDKSPSVHLSGCPFSQECSTVFNQPRALSSRHSNEPAD